MLLTPSLSCVTRRGWHHEQVTAEPAAAEASVRARGLAPAPVAGRRGCGAQGHVQLPGQGEWRRGEGPRAPAQEILSCVAETARPQRAAEPAQA